MVQVLSLRNRISMVLIFGSISLLLYGYHYVTTNDIYQLRMLTGDRQSSESHSVRSISNEDGETPSVWNAISGLQDLQASQSIGKQLPASNLSSSSSTSSLVSSNMSKSGEKPEAEGPIESQKLIENSPTAAGDSGSTTVIDRAGDSNPVQETCPEFGANLELLILIMSAPSNAKARDAIRLTWGHFGQRKDMSIAFVLGDTTEPEVEEVISNEQKIYGDIIRKKFVDSYSNLTRKVISALEWVCDHCSRVKFVLKTDDDMFINVSLLLKFIKDHSEERNVIFGRLASDWKPRRDPKDKYYVSTAEFSGNVFPPFMSGPAYLLSSDVIPKLYETALQQPPFKLEDVLITGIAAAKVGINLKGAKEFVNERISFAPCKIQTSISLHGVKYPEQFDLWKKLLDGVAKCKT